MNRRRHDRPAAGRALFATLGSTLALLRWLLAGLFALYAVSGLTRVAPHEDALVYRFGRLQRTLHAPGLCFALPAPIDRVVKIPTRTQFELAILAWTPEPGGHAAATTAVPAAPRLPGSLLAVLPGANGGAAATPAPGARGLHPVYDGYTLTGDTNIVQGRFLVRYRIAAPYDYAAAAPAAVAALLERAVLAAATRTLARIRIDDALATGLEALRTEIRQRAQERADTLRLGVELLAVEIDSLLPPAAAAPAFAEVTSAQVEARTLLEQARTYRAEQQPRTAGEVYRLRRQADADGSELVAKATGEAAAFLALRAEHRRNPGLVAARLQAETAEQVFARVRTRTAVPADLGQLNLNLREK